MVAGVGFEPTTSGPADGVGERKMTARRAQNSNSEKRRAQSPLARLSPWLRGLDLNQRPPGYEPDELPGCSTPRLFIVQEINRVVNACAATNCYTPCRQT